MLVLFCDAVWRRGEEVSGKLQQPGFTPERAELMRRIGLEWKVLQKIREGRFWRQSKERQTKSHQSGRELEIHGNRFQYIVK